VGANAKGRRDAKRERKGAKKVRTARKGMKKRRENCLPLIAPDGEDEMTVGRPEEDYKKGTPVC